MTKDREETEPTGELPPERAARPVAGRVGEGARLRIGRDLRRLYAEVLDLPLPDRLARLVDDLASASDREGSR